MIDRARAREKLEQTVCYRSNFNSRLYWAAVVFLGSGWFGGRPAEWAVCEY